MEWIKGVDVSTLLEVERCGGRFFDGGREGDALEILRANGANYVRLRLWNDPRDAAGRSYGAGVCDLAHTLALAKRAVSLGMRWLLDLHYSDFWADPGKQTVPKAWRGLDAAGLERAIEAYTREVLAACRDAGVMPDMVQVGNELTYGLLWPYGRTPEWENISRFLGAGVRAVRACAPEALVMIHLDNGGNRALYRDWFGEFFARGGDCDVIGLSYYPLWHGTMEDLRANLHALAARHGKPLIIAETSMGFTLEDYGGHERLGPGARKGAAAKPSLAAQVAYPMTEEGQAAFLRDLLGTVASVPGGLGRGIFWWEPAWVPVPGSGWATEAGWTYVNERGPGGNEWANQALFDYEGRTLPALRVFRDFQPGAGCEN